MGPGSRASAEECGESKTPVRNCEVRVGRERAVTRQGGRGFKQRKASATEKQRRASVARRDRIVVSTLRCGRSNLGSTPSHGTLARRVPCAFLPLSRAEEGALASRFESRRRGPCLPFSYTCLGCAPYLGSPGKCLLPPASKCGWPGRREADAMVHQTHEENVNALHVSLTST